MPADRWRAKGRKVDEMSNYIDNKLTVTGPAEAVSAFAEKACGRDPLPALSRHPTIARVEAEERAAQGEREPLPLSFHKIVPLPDAYTSEPYDPFGYNAEREAWGVKWGAFNVGEAVVSPDGRAITYTFQTAWSAPEKWLLAASYAWPTLTFHLSYGGEGPARGRIRAHAGCAVTQHDKYDAADYPTCPDDADDAAEEAYCEAYSAAERIYITSHDEWVETAHDRVVAELRAGVPAGVLVSREDAAVVRAVLAAAERGHAIAGEGREGDAWDESGLEDAVCDYERAGRPLSKEGA